MPNFELVNPFIVGNMKKTFNAADGKSAASEAWNSLSQYVTNNVPKFAFTIRKIDSGKLYHYVVKEKLAKDKSVNFSIKELKLSLTKEQENAFNQQLQKLELSSQGKLVGGKKSSKKDSSSDSSSTDSDSSSEEDIYQKIRHFKNKSQPLNYMWYSPIVYSKSGTLESVYVPSFTYPIVPYLELSLSTLVWKFP